MKYIKKKPYVKDIFERARMRVEEYERIEAEKERLLEEKIAEQEKIRQEQEKIRQEKALKKAKERDLAIKTKRTKKIIQENHSYTFNDYREVEKKYNTSDIIVKPKYKNRTTRLRLLSSAIMSTILLSSKIAIAALPISNYAYVHSHPTFKYSKVIKDLEYYGGADFLIDRKPDLSFLLQQPLVSHFKESSTGVIAIDSDPSFPPIIAQALEECVDYLNNIFSVINPKYKFKLGYFGKLNSQIWIQQSKGLPAAATMLLVNPFATSYPTITVLNYGDKVFSDSIAANKIVILHEFLHILLGCPDLDSPKPDYVTLLEYSDTASISLGIDSKISEAKMNEDYAAVEKYQKYTSYMPVDLATLISVYGDSSKPENVKKYEALLKDCMTKCRDVLGFKNYYKYHNSIEWLKELDAGQESDKGMEH